MTDTGPELLPTDFANTPCDGWCLGDCPGCCACRTKGCAGCPAGAQTDADDDRPACPTCLATRAVAPGLAAAVDRLLPPVTTDPEGQSAVADAPALPPVPQLTDEQRDQVLHAMAELATVAQAVATAFVHAVLPAVQAAAQQLAAFQRQLQNVGLLDAEGRHVRTADRPAWQSPYGPPTRRH